ncbi:MAG: hypothetical protein JKY15_03880 [Deltaproteobacteria bacterium]|nr:hypothetical protein [Deltaproteobacteria bacterium]
MIFGIIVALNVAFLLLIFAAFRKRVKILEAESPQGANPQRGPDQKISKLREEISALKEESARKSKQVEELRENAKRRMRKNAQKETQEEVSNMTQSSPQSSNFDVALKTVQQQAAQSHQEELKQLKERYDEKISKLQTQLGVRKQSIEKNKKKLNEELMASAEGLPEDVIQEMGRLIKRSEHAEKLFSATRGKLQMSQERFSEMQKRYFGVCRELALATGQNLEITDLEARDQAENILDASEKGA